MAEWILLIAGLVVGVFLALLLAGILLRLACLICRVEQPGLLRATIIAVAAGVASLLASLGVEVTLYTIVDPQTYQTSYVPSIVSFVLSLLFGAVVSTVLFKVLLRVQWWQAALVWLVQWALNIALLMIIAVAAFVWTLINPAF